MVVPGAALALERHPEVNFLLFGNKERVEPYLLAYPELADRSRIVHTDTVGRDAGQAKPGGPPRPRLQHVAGDRGRAEGRGRFRRLGRQHRRPDGHGQADPQDHARHRAAGHRRPVADRRATNSIVLDLGANIGATALQLADFALMGAAMARAILGVERPRVGLLNIGVEEIKGIEEVRQAHAWLKETDLPIDYRGFVEGDQIGQGVVDVVVVEGYAGNIALKTAEGTAKQMATYVREALTSSLPASSARSWPKAGCAS